MVRNSEEAADLLAQSKADNEWITKIKRNAKNYSLIMIYLFVSLILQLDISPLQNLFNSMASMFWNFFTDTKPF